MQSLDLCCVNDRAIGDVQLFEVLSGQHSEGSLCSFENFEKEYFNKFSQTGLFRYIEESRKYVDDFWNSLGLIFSRIKNDESVVDKEDARKNMFIYYINNLHKPNMVMAILFDKRIQSLIEELHINVFDLFMRIKGLTGINLLPLLNKKEFFKYISNHDFYCMSGTRHAGVQWAYGSFCAVEYFFSSLEKFGKDETISFLRNVIDILNYPEKNACRVVEICSNLVEKKKLSAQEVLDFLYWKWQDSSDVGGVKGRISKIMTLFVLKNSDLNLSEDFWEKIIKDAIIEGNFDVVKILLNDSFNNEMIKREEIKELFACYNSVSKIEYVGYHPNDYKESLERFYSGIFRLIYFYSYAKKQNDGDMAINEMSKHALKLIEVLNELQNNNLGILERGFLMFKNMHPDMNCVFCNGSYSLDGLSEILTKRFCEFDKLRNILKRFVIKPLVCNVGNTDTVAPIIPPTVAPIISPTVSPIGCINAVTSVSSLDCSTSSSVVPDFAGERPE